MNSKVPAHVSIIMDGNGRWAQQRGKERVFGHSEGVESVRACTEAAVEMGIPYLSLFAFSEENWDRPREEVGFLMEMMLRSIKNELPALKKNNVRFLVLGNRSRLSEGLNASIDDCSRETEANTGLTLIIFLSYSGRWDILQAAKRLALACAGDPEKIDNLRAEDFSSQLVTAGIPDPDLIIRTSGEKRLSNYLCWQGAWSELVFTDVLWPDFRKNEFREAVEEYSVRERRYGKII